MLSLDKYYSVSPGIDTFLNAINKISRNGGYNYPPYNIIKDGENDYTMEFAVAGFSKEELSVTVEEGYLKVEGSTKMPKSVDIDAENSDNELRVSGQTPEYLHRGISSRDFTLKFPLADKVEVQDATIEHGMLRVSMRRMVASPEVIKIL